jgi:hypothetical protein
VLQFETATACEGSENFFIRHWPCCAPSGKAAFSGKAVDSQILMVVQGWNFNHPDVVFSGFLFCAG